MNVKLFRGGRVEIYSPRCLPKFEFITFNEIILIILIIIIIIIIIKQ